MKTTITVESGKFEPNYLISLLKSNPLYVALNNAKFDYVHDLTQVAPGLAFAEAFVVDGKLVWTYHPLTDIILALVQDTDNESETYVYLNLTL